MAPTWWREGLVRFFLCSAVLPVAASSAAEDYFGPGSSGSPVSPISSFSDRKSVV